MKTSLTFLSVLNLAAAAVPQPRTPAGCGVDNCFWRGRIPKDLQPHVASFCKLLVKPQEKPCTTSSLLWSSSAAAASPSSIHPIISTLVETLPAQTLQETPNAETVVQTYQSTTTVYDSVQETVTATQGTLCVETTTIEAATTQITFPRFTRMGIKAREEIPGLSEQDALELEKLVKKTNLPFFASTGCRKAPTLQRMKDACNCFLGIPRAVPSPSPAPVVPKSSSVQVPVIVVTSQQAGATIVQTLPAATVTVVQTMEPHVVSITTTDTITATLASCTSTSTSIVGAVTISNCGAPAGVYPSATTGMQPTCIQPANAPSGSVNAYHRIEGGSEGTVFEGCIYAGPRSITTPSGGTHQCGASTGTTITSQMDAAGQLFGFSYDGSFSPSFNDYFITRIGSTQQAGNSYWGVLNNGVFTTSGGCGAQVRPGDSSLWQWDAFSLQTLLTITPSYAVAATGSQIKIKVTARSPNGGGSTERAGAVLSGDQGLVSDANGEITFTAPTVPGCYQYKATADRSGRSNAFFLNVVAGFPATLA